MNALTGNFYQRIKEIRERVGLSQEDLANRMDIKRVTVSQIENGHRKICTEELIKLSRIFNITTDVLLNLDEDIEVVLEKIKKQKPKIKNEIRINVPQKNLVKFKEVLENTDFILNLESPLSNFLENQMANNRNFRKPNTPAKVVTCSCGGQAKLCSRKNYPFGKKSRGILSVFYKCGSCQKLRYVNKIAGGK